MQRSQKCTVEEGGTTSSQAAFSPQHYKGKCLSGAGSELRSWFTVELAVEEVE